jgi:aminopeptidase
MTLCVLSSAVHLKSLQSVESALKRKVQEGLVEQRAIFHRRSAEGSLRWVLCEFPTPASAQECGMSLGEYEDFIFKACKLDILIPLPRGRIFPHRRTKSYHGSRRMAE